MDNISFGFTSFTQTILREFQEKLGGDYTVSSHSVRKNNGIELTGIVAKRKGSNAAPALYINDLYREGMTGDEIKKAADKLYRDFQAAEFEGSLDLSDFADFEKAKKKMAFKLISREKNKELLKTIPYKIFHDLALAFYYIVQEPPFYGKASVLINNSHLEYWGISVDMLYGAAFENAPALLPSVIENMKDIMCDAFADSLASDLSHEQGEESLFDEGWIQEVAGQMADTTQEMPMYVLTNRPNLYGAATVLYPGVLKVFAEKVGQDLYILPSSVHEMILIPAGVNVNQEVLGRIVTDINRTHVAEDEVLADSVYYYSRDIDKVLWLSKGSS